MNKTPNLEGIKTDKPLYVWKDNETGESGITNGLAGVFFKERLLDITRIPDDIIPFLATKEHDEELLREFRWFVNENDVSSADATGVIDFWIKEFIASRKVSSSGEGK